MKYIHAMAASALLAGVCASASAQWSTFAGTGHYYGVFLIEGGDHSWSAARAQAQAKIAPNGQTGDLATLTSADENAFVFALADFPQFWAMDGAGNNEGHYLGGFQPEGSPEPAGGWQWVTGEAWSYTSWMSGEPNNWGGEEDFLCYFAIGGARTDRWNDVGDSASAVHRRTSSRSFRSRLPQQSSAWALLPLPEDERGLRKGEQCAARPAPRRAAATFLWAFSSLIPRRG